MCITLEGSMYSVQGYAEKRVFRSITKAIKHVRYMGQVPVFNL